MSRWDGTGVWVGDGVRREVFFFASGGVELYGSLYASVEPSRPHGLLACNSWGTEADRSEPLLREVALAMARLGGAALVFHYPGYGDSHGDLAAVGLEDLVGAACDAAAEAARRRPGLAWTLGGFMLGAAVAALARRRLNPRALLLVQPELRPGAYFERLARSSEPLAPGSSPRAMMRAGSTPGMAYGYPIPPRILARGVEADAAVAAALTGHGAGGAVIRHAAPEEPGPTPPGLERVEVPGSWRFGSQNNPRLARAAIAWLEAGMRGA